MVDSGVTKGDEEASNAMHAYSTVEVETSSGSLHPLCSKMITGMLCGDELEADRLNGTPHFTELVRNSSNFQRLLYSCQ